MVECDMMPEATPLEHLDSAPRAARRASRRARPPRGQLHTAAGIGPRAASAARRRVQLRVAERAVQGDLHPLGRRRRRREFLAKLVDRRPRIEEARRVSRRGRDGLASMPGGAMPSRRRSTAGSSRPQSCRSASGWPRPRADAVGSATRLRGRDRRGARQSPPGWRRRRTTARTEGLQAETRRDRAGASTHQLHRRRLLEQARVLLEETRAAFARDHQPPVLREASRWLARLTEGQYPSITTSIDEARLEVHDADGRILESGAAQPRHPGAGVFGPAAGAGPRPRAARRAVCRW